MQRAEENAELGGDEAAAIDSNHDVTAIRSRFDAEPFISQLDAGSLDRERDVALDRAARVDREQPHDACAESRHVTSGQHDGSSRSALTAMHRCGSAIASPPNDSEFCGEGPPEVSAKLDRGAAIRFSVYHERCGPAYRANSEI